MTWLMIGIVVAAGGLIVLMGWIADVYDTKDNVIPLTQDRLRQLDRLARQRWQSTGDYR